MHRIPSQTYKYILSIVPFLAVAILIYHQVQDPNREFQREVQTRTPSTDRLGVLKPHPQVTHMFGEVQRQLFLHFPAKKAHNAPVITAGAPPTHIQDLKQFPAYQTGDPTLWAVSKGLHCLKGTRSSATGENLTWVAVVQEQQVEVLPGIFQTQFSPIYLKQGSQQWGTLPKHLQNQI